MKSSGSKFWKDFIHNWFYVLSVFSESISFLEYSDRANYNVEFLGRKMTSSISFDFQIFFYVLISKSFYVAV